MPELVLKLGDNVLQNYVFDKDVMSIGRSRDNDIVVENLSVSRNHARIRRQNGKYVLTDLNSANGTYVNGVRISKTEIVNDDVISVGKHRLHFADAPLEEDKMIADAFGADRTVVVEKAAAPVLCISDGKLKGQEFHITRFETSIGKSPSNDIVLSDDWFLAKKQAVIIRRGNHEYEIHDMGGFRRTKVNGVQITEPKALQSGDVMDFGNTRCVFQFSGEMPVPSGRVPQEMALEDSIFSSGISYENESSAPRDVETPFVQESHITPDAKEAASAEEMVDTGDMARAAIEADERARAEARQATPFYGPAPVHSAPAPAQENGRPQEAAPVDLPTSRSMDDLAELSLDDVGSLMSTFHESQAEEPAESEPAPVYAGAPEEQMESAAEANTPQGAEMMYGGAPASAAVPLMPSASPAQVPNEPLASPSGGRSNRKKKRDRDRLPPPAQAAQAEAAASEDNGAQEVQAPSFEARPDEGEAAEQGAAAQTPEPAKTSAAGKTGEGLNDEIALWEAALNNRSAVIRKQAAKMLKKLTGKDYEV